MPLPIGGVAAGVRIEPYKTILSYAPTVYWRMDEASGTIVNSGSTASRNLTGTNLTYAQTKIPTRSPKTSISFNGTSSLATVGTGVITDTNPVFSGGCWIKTTTTSTVVLFQQKDATNNGNGFVLSLTNGVLPTLIGLDTSGATDFSVDGGSGISIINDGAAVFISFTISATLARLYVNGGMVGEATRVGGVWSNSSDIFVGRSHTAANYYGGTMSDVFLTNEVLTADDHNKIYRNGLLNSTSPLGDNFNDALVVTPTGSPASVGALAMGNAQLEVNEPDNGSGSPIDSNKSVWLKFTAGGANLGYTFTSSTTHNYMDAYHDTDGTLAGLEYIATAVGFSNGSLFIPTENGETYYVRVRTYVQETGTINVSASYATIPDPPANDDFASAQLISVVSAGTVSGTTAGATIEVTDETIIGSGDPRSVWYKFQADATGNITLDTEDTPAADTVIEVWQGTASTTIDDIDVNTAYADDDDSGTASTALVTFGVTIGSWYYVMINDYDGGADFILSWSDIT